MKAGTMNGGNWIRPAKRLAIYIRDGFECAYCGRDLRSAPPREVTLDHLVPRSAGGSNEATKLITACLHCNSSRGDRPVEDFATPEAIARIEALRHQPLNLALAKSIIASRAGDSCVA